MTFKPGTIRDANGTSLQGYVKATLNDLRYAFGTELPEPFDPDKVVHEWCLVFEDGTVATVYDYKGTTKTASKPYMWHVGGFTREAKTKVEQALADSKNVIDFSIL